MNRSDIIKQIAELYPKFNRKEIELIVKQLLLKMHSNLINGNRIEIRGFGCFSLKRRAPGKVRNPRRGIAIDAGERHVVYFRAGKELRERVDIYNR